MKNLQSSITQPAPTNNLFKSKSFLSRKDNLPFCFRTTFSIISCKFSSHIYELCLSYSEEKKHAHPPTPHLSPAYHYMTYFCISPSLYTPRHFSCYGFFNNLFINSHLSFLPSSPSHFPNPWISFILHLLPSFQIQMGQNLK